ncbi:MAG: hypothetical protein HRT72_12880 [Flavobacteriales bacterium]|nr:hypothetical protein [Flavobacteriales bacterium]
MLYKRPLTSLLEFSFHITEERFYQGKIDNYSISIGFNEKTGFDSRPAIWIEIAYKKEKLSIKERMKKYASRMRKMNEEKNIRNSIKTQFAWTPSSIYCELQFSLFPPNLKSIMAHISEMISLLKEEGLEESSISESNFIYPQKSKQAFNINQGPVFEVYTV